MDGGRPAGRPVFFPLQIAGWQRICFHYSWNSGIQARAPDALQATDRIVFEAPADAAGGTVYLDGLVVNRPFDFRDASPPVVHSWAPYAIETDPHKDLLAPPTAEERVALERFLPRRRADGAVREAPVAQLEARIAERYRFRRLADGAWVGRSADRKDLTGDMNAVAALWALAGDDALAERLAQVYIRLDDHFRELGAVPQGSVRDLNNYDGRLHGDACFTMLEPLRRTGRLERMRNTLKYNYAYDQIFADGPAARSMDFHYNDVRYLFSIALMHDTPEETIRHLRAFRRFYDHSVTDTIKPDGSLYHHGAHYFAYASGAMASTADTFARILNTPFQPSREAFEAAKRALLAMRYYANLYDLPVSLHGRHPGRQRIDPGWFLRFAEIGRAYHDGALDRDLAAAYLRLKPEEAGKPEFTREHLQAERLEGNLAMNYAGLMGHRRDDWLAMVRGYGRYYWAQESYANQNRYGLFMGNGCLDILAAGHPIGLLDSGCDLAKGWDWRHFDGSTTLRLPYARMANGNGTWSEYSDVGFVGELTHRGHNGLFVLPLRSRAQYVKAMDEGQTAKPGERFEADKTYFFFDDRIVCLGAGIRARDVRHPAATTLFQKHLQTPGTPISVDGDVVDRLPFETDLDPRRPHTLLDIQQTGYVIPAGQRVHVVRRHQTSRDGHDTADTEGNYALAWFDHGVSPDNGAYAYIARVRTTAGALAAFARGMESTQPPVKVLQRDALAHVVFDAATRSVGYVIFDAAFTNRFSTESRRWIVQSASRPCLAMEERQDDGRRRISLCDPDLHLANRLSVPSELTVRLGSGWRAVEGPEDARVERGENAGDTFLTVRCREGRSYEFLLAEDPAPPLP